MSDDEDIGEWLGIEKTEEKQETFEYDAKKGIPQLFDWLNSIMSEKNEMIRDQEYPADQMEKAYVPFPINRGVSMGMDTILLANEMNRLWSLPNEAQYRFYLHKIRKMKRRNSWQKAEKNDDLNLIARRYGCNLNVARQYLKLLTEDDLQSLRKLYDFGGVAKKKKG